MSPQFDIDLSSLEALVERCIDAHRPDPLHVELGLADVRYALVQSGASIQMLHSFDRDGQRLLDGE